jgi:hypothetical protein
MKAIIAFSPEACSSKLLDDISQRQKQKLVTSKTNL